MRDNMGNLESELPHATSKHTDEASPQSIEPRRVVAVPHVERERALHFPSELTAPDPDVSVPPIPFFTVTEADGRQYDLMSVPIDHPPLPGERQFVVVRETATLLFVAAVPTDAALPEPNPATQDRYPDPVFPDGELRIDRHEAEYGEQPQGGETHGNVAAGPVEIVDVAALEAEKRGRRQQQNREAQRRWRKNNPAKKAEQKRRWRKNPAVKAREAAAGRDRYHRKKASSQDPPLPTA